MKTYLAKNEYFKLAPKGWSKFLFPFSIENLFLPIFSGEKVFLITLLLPT